MKIELRDDGLYFKKGKIVGEKIKLIFSEKEIEEVTKGVKVKKGDTKKIPFNKGTLTIRG